MDEVHLPMLEPPQISKQEINEFLKKMNKEIARNPKIDIKDEDLNRMRGYIISAAPTSYTLRLLQKKREDRNADKDFQDQLENIIKKAAELDNKTSEYFKAQEEMKKIVKDNGDKISELARMKTRAQNDISERTQEIEKFKKENLLLTNSLSELKKMEILIERGITKYNSYETYIKDVVKNTDEFDKKVENLISRHKILKIGLDHMKTEVYQSLERKKCS